MYRLARLFLIAGSLLTYVDFALLLILFWPASLPVALLVWQAVQRRPPRLTSHGSARWAGRSELRRAGLLGANRGLILGRLAADGDKREGA